MDATDCVSCHSANDPKCSTGNYSTQFKECFGANPCAVAIVTNTGHTFRGCSSDAECYDDNNECETCDGNGCNSAAFPTDRLSCVTCTSADGNCQHLANTGQYNAACVLHFQDGACVTYFNGFTPARRACLADLDQSIRDICEQQRPECVMCRENNCNVVNIRLDEQCLQCDSQDRGCTDGNYTASACEKISEGKCYSKQLDDGTVKRGCFYELTSEEASNCNSTTCVICSGSGCNTVGWIPHTSQLSCKSCHSAKTPACVRKPSTVLPKDCPEDDTACATVLLSETGHLYRGCSTDAECVAEGDACVTCDEFRNCNNWLYPSDRMKCNICETSANKNCATLPYYKQFEKLCLRHVQSDRCVTIFDGFHVVRRECESGLSEDDAVKCGDGSRECVICSGTGCNKISVRRDDSCLQCTSDVPNCANGRKASAVCNLASDGVCYNRLDVDGKLHRGCLSDLSEELQKNCQDPNDLSCETCTGEGCNNNLFPGNAFRCVECESEKDLACVQQQISDALVTPCKLQINEDKCYTRMHIDGSIDRGCLSSLTTPCSMEYNVTCATCEGDACNVGIYPEGRRSCFQCDGLYDHNCGLDQMGTNGSMVCRKFKENDGCYILLEKGKVKRGCTSEYDVDICKGMDTTQCQICYQDHCNKISEIGLRSPSTCLLVNASVLFIGFIAQMSLL